MPEELGGGSISGHPFADVAVLADESGRHVAPGPLVPCNVVAWVLAQANSDQHADSLAAIVDGSAVAAWALAEGNAAGIRPPSTTRAERSQDGYVISGVKQFVEAAPDADLFLVTAATKMALVSSWSSRSAPGVTVLAEARTRPDARLRHRRVRLDSRTGSGARRW